MSLRGLMSMVVVCGLVIVGVFYYLNRTVSFGRSGCMCPSFSWGAKGWQRGGGGRGIVVGTSWLGASGGWSVVQPTQLCMPSS